MAFTLEHIKEIAERVASSSGLEVVELELRGSGKARRLRIFIDKAQGVTHEDCANFSREIGTIIDVEDALPGGSYVLEVSSPGLDRKLLKPADFERFQGSLIKFSTHEPVNGNRHFEGRLISFADGQLTVDIPSAEDVPSAQKRHLPAKPKAAAGKPKSPPRETGTMQFAYSNIEKAKLVPEF
jgi:ribosome maturation factor RimP